MWMDGPFTRLQVPVIGLGIGRLGLYQYVEPAHCRCGLSTDHRLHKGHNHLFARDIDSTI